MKPFVIALYSPAMGSGKTTAADWLCKYHGYTPAKFAGALKYMIANLFQYTTGAQPEEILSYIEGKDKLTPIEWAGDKTARDLMQTLGTEWGRQCVTPELWVNITRERIFNLVRGGHSVVIDDMRFENEFQMVADLPIPTALVRIERPKASNANTHSSEGLLEGFPFTNHIVNEGTKKKFLTKVSALVAEGDLTFHNSTPEKPK